jgi:hypothetical protein
MPASRQPNAFYRAPTRASVTSPGIRGMGTALSLYDPKLAELRKWRVNGFEKFLIFYLSRPGGVSIVRVLHAAQDWWGLLGML